MMRNVVKHWLILGLIFSLGAGCASQTKTVVRDHAVRYPADASQPSPQPVVIEKRTTSTITTHGEPQGILSTTVHVVGEILALPFRLLGRLMRLVF